MGPQYLQKSPHFRSVYILKSRQNCLTTLNKIEVSTTLQESAWSLNRSILTYRPLKESWLFFNSLTLFCLCLLLYSFAQGVSYI